MINTNILNIIEEHIINTTGCTFSKKYYFIADKQVKLVTKMHEFKKTPKKLMIKYFEDKL